MAEVVESRSPCHAVRVSESQAVRPPKAYRVVDRALVAGVCVGLAAHSRFAVWAIRAAFVLTSFWKFSGAVAYAVLWILLPTQKTDRPLGLVAAERAGQRLAVRVPSWPRMAGWLGSLAMGSGITYAISVWDDSALGEYAWILFLIGVGVAFVWMARETVVKAWVKVLVSVVGVMIVWAAGAAIQARLWVKLATMIQPEFHNYLAALFITGTAVIGYVVIGLPWLRRPPQTEEAKKAELIAETRADMAAHLHDSVLQTLAVIQKRASDAKVVAQLARRQEKELREWLFEEPSEGETVTSALKDVVAEVESTYPVVVELVTVGDQEMTVRFDAVVRAAREAIVNAAKHSEADKIDVYAEISAYGAEVFVRDRGRGFDIDDIRQDRQGIRHSILERTTRYGGVVAIRSTPGEGTEIHLSMPVPEEGQGYD